MESAVGSLQYVLVWERRQGIMGNLVKKTRVTSDSSWSNKSHSYRIHSS